MEESINRLPFTCQRGQTDGNIARASQYLSLKRICTGKLLKPPVRACSRHHQIKFLKSCGYIMYRLATKEQCMFAIQVIIFGVMTTWCRFVSVTSPPPEHPSCTHKQYDLQKYTRAIVMSSTKCTKYAKNGHISSRNAYPANWKVFPFPIRIISIISF